MNDIGKLGGILDAKDPLQEGPVRLITNPELSPNNLDNPNMTAGVTFLGQFIDHDVTFDASSPLGVVAEPTATTNTRDTRLDLDSVFGGGPSVSPNLYSSSDPAKFIISSGGLFEDLPRDTSRRAIIADPRNDENLIISGLHAAFLLAHNRTVDFRRANNLPGDTWFYSRRTVIHHYQWIVVHEFLPTVVGQALVDDIFRNGLRWYRFGNPTMPVEFQTGTFRMGHSMVRPSYRANLLGDRDPVTGAPAPFFGFIFDPAGEGQTDPVDLRGRARARRRFIGWQTFFDFGGAARHQDLHPPVQTATAGHRERRPANLARSAKPAAPPDVVAAVRAAHRVRDRFARAQLEQLHRVARLRARPGCKHAVVVLHPERGAGPRQQRHTLGAGRRQNSRRDHPRAARAG
jgi:hypothetical protein